MLAAFAAIPCRLLTWLPDIQIRPKGLARDAGRLLDFYDALGRHALAPLPDGRMRNAQCTRQLGCGPAPLHVFAKSIHSSYASPSSIAKQEHLAPADEWQRQNHEVEEKLSETFGTRLRKARDAKHLTLNQVATVLGMDGHQAIANWEHGYNFPGCENLVEVARLYQVSIDWLVWGTDVSDNITARVRRIPKVLRDGLMQRIHQEIDKTEELASRLPKEMVGEEHIRDFDPKLKSWSAANKRKRPRVKGGTQ